MALDLRATVREFSVHDESGYAFKLVTTWDPEAGWSAVVNLDGKYMATEQAAIDKAVVAAQQFIRIATSKEGYT